ncbi:MAG TPA: trypsin-like peptidase domain-containing protein [Blastocatellia bacterium]|nr:trypsin-like peptidase domain-containing protein [Blastocatellia bacterium]
MYRVTGKQLAALAILSALFAGVIVTCAQRAMDSGQRSEERPVLADPSVASDEQNNIEIYREYSPAVVNITSKSYAETWFGVYPQEGSGSGSIIDDKGHILTNYHVVQGTQQLDVQIENEKYPARLIGSDPDNDLAVIKVNAPRNHLKTIKLGTSKGLQVGQKVLAIGNPFGLQHTLTTGIISGLERPLRDPASRRTIEGAIQTDASINPGNSGGPLLNAKGEMIGINTAIYSPSGGSVGIGFAVPVDTANAIIPDLIGKGYVSRPWLGINIMPLNRRAARLLGLPVDEGIMVGAVYRGSGAAAAGLRAASTRDTVFGGLVIVEAGDVIVSIDGRPVTNSDDLQRALSDRHPGQTVSVEIIRQGRRMTVQVRLSERPQQAR